MRNLTFTEFNDKFNDYSSDIEYSKFDDIQFKLDDFFNFLDNQDISKNILERITNDFLEIKILLDSNSSRNHRIMRQIVESIDSREKRGALAYFLIREKFNIELRVTHKYINLTHEWYKVGVDFYQTKEKFITYLFKPFAELFEWYLYESDTTNEDDYFSKKTQQEILEKLDKIESLLVKSGMAQEIIFKEIEETAELSKKLKKKNWNEVIKGKFIDLALKNVISIETAKKIIELLTGNDINLLN